jgi:hypothetical protein
LSDSEGLLDFLQQSLARTLWGRRTHRVSRGSSVTAGTMSYASTNPREPLSPRSAPLPRAATAG